MFVFSAGPGSCFIKKSNEYYNQFKKVVFDSGFFVLLLRIFKNINVKKFSGYKFLNLFFKNLKRNKNKKVFCIDPNPKYLRSNHSFLKNLGINNLYNYLAPEYKIKKFSDKKLLKRLEKIKPDFILTNIGGGKQEILGLYLKKNLKIKSTILCTGAAISFFTKDQAPINILIDQLYLGWFVRLIFNPLIFLKRYFHSLKLVPMVIYNKIVIIN